MKVVGATGSYFVTRFISIFLVDAARTWLDHSRESNIKVWYNLQKLFVDHFGGTYTKPGSTWELMSCSHNKGESLRDFVKRFTRKKNDLQNVPGNKVIDVFMRECKAKALCRRAGRSR